MQMKVLVTGAAGFLGSRLVEILLEAKFAVVGLDVLDGQEPDGWQKARLETALQNRHFGFVQVNVTDADALRNAIVEARPGAVVHLASRKDLDWADTSACSCIDLHAGGTANVLQACRKAGVAHLLVGSSSHVYGGSRNIPFCEDDPIDQPLSVLGVAMRAAELCARAMSLDTQLAVTVVRLFSLYGPRQSPVRLLPALVWAAQRREPMPVYGDGTAGRDMLHVDDAVVALIHLLKRPWGFRVLNLGSGQTTTLAQVSEMVSWIAGSKWQTNNLPSRIGEMPHTFADTHALQKTIGFQPTIGLEDGIRGYMEWHKNRPDVFKTFSKGRTG